MTGKSGVPITDKPPSPWSRQARELVPEAFDSYCVNRVNDAMSTPTTRTMTDNTNRNSNTGQTSDRQNGKWFNKANGKYDLDYDPSTQASGIGTTDSSKDGSFSSSPLPQKDNNVMGDDSGHQKSRR